MGTLCLELTHAAASALAYTASADEREELVSAAIEGVWRRALKHRPGKQPLRRYIQQSAFHSIKDVLRKRRHSHDGLDHVQLRLTPEWELCQPREEVEPEAPKAKPKKHTCRQSGARSRRSHRQGRHARPAPRT
jgi:DNA-directed RNA polymerase specialized sigma24 family protein